MDRAFSLDTYQFGAQSLPFWVASATVLAMMLYALLVRGAPALRYSFLGICACVLPFVLGYALASSTSDLAVAKYHVHWCVAFTPAAGAFVMTFDMALARCLARYRRLLVVAFASSAVFAGISLSTEWITDGVWVTPSGIPFATNGPLGALSGGLIGLWVVIGTVVLWRGLATEPSPRRRRQYRGAIWAFSISALGVLDVLLGWQVGYGPVSWFFLTVGSLIALRSLMTDDLVHAGSLDRGALLGLVYLTAAVAGVWTIAEGDRAAPVAVAVVALFLALRAAVAIGRFLSRREIASDSPLERAFERFVKDVRSVESVEGVAAASSELLDLALGVESVSFLAPSEGDYSWRIAGGDPLIEEATPDPRLLSWFVEHRKPIARDDLVAARLAELRDPMERLFDTHGAEIVVPLVNRDELSGLVVLGALRSGRAPRPKEIELLERVAEHATAAVVYSTMFREANQRVEVDKEVELAAAVQDAFIPPQTVKECGSLTVQGHYEPASRCGGDWWSAHELSEHKSLLLIGDVTGHGVAAAMVTAAAKGCYDVALRLMGDDVDLDRLLQLLHRAVYRTGGEQFYMTCFASLIDRQAGTVQFANAGHVVPYVCRRSSSGQLRLDVLVARGNPLGAIGDASYEVHSRSIEPGDVLIWYTDGLTECTNPAGEQFGDRRFQRLIRRAVERGDADVHAICDKLVRETHAFHAGQPPADDITLVVGQLT